MTMHLPRWLSTVPLRLRSFVNRRRLYRELDEELAYHVDCRTEHFLRSGLTAPEARARAERELGGGIRVREQVRDTWAMGWIDTSIQDVRYAIRVLVRSSGFTAVTVLTIALGVGANTAMFSLVNGVLLRPLPFPEPERLVHVTGSYPQGGLAMLRERSKTMDVASYAAGHDFNMTGLGMPVRLAGASVSAEFFSVLGVGASVGRTFVSGEDLAGRDALVVLSHAVWQQQFGSDPHIIGRSIVLDGVSREVVGVMPPGFRFPSAGTQLWTPLHIDSSRTDTYWAGDYMPVIGRLRPGRTLAEAGAEARLLQSRLRPLFPWPMPPEWNADVRATTLKEAVVGDVRTRLLLLLGAVGLVLGIACANVANLLLSRGATRQGEIGLRVALGAARVRIVRQLLTESLILACWGAIAGFVAGSAGLRVLKATLPPDTPRLAEVSIDWRTVAFAAALAVVAAALFGLAPALQAARSTLTDGLKSGARGTLATGQRLRRTMVVSEVALAAMLVVASGVLIRSFWNLSQVEPGFRTERLLTLRVSPNQTACTVRDRCVSLHRAFGAGIAALPGFEDAAFINTLPLGGRIAKRSVVVHDFVLGRDAAEPLFWLNTISPGYFNVMGIAVRQGRAFTDADAAGAAPVAIVTAATAQRFWPGQEAVGKRLKLVGQDTWHTVVGVVSDVRAYDLQRDLPPWIHGMLYVPYGPASVLEDGSLPVAVTLVVRTAVDQQVAAEMVRQAVARVDRDASVSEVRAMADVVSEAAAAPRSTMLLFVLFAALAVGLGMTGIYGVLSFLVSKRAREIGIRVALGARWWDVLRLVVGEGAAWALLGIVAGLGCALALTRLLAGELYGVSATDPPTFVAAGLLLFTVTLAACYLPARRAMRVDPVLVLRAE
jgi:putative ABC transport system permease protein